MGCATFPPPPASRLGCVLRPFLRCVPSLVVLLGLLPGLGAAGQLSRSDVARRFGPPLQVQEKLRDIPAWPITTALEPEGGPVGYVFESIDLAPIPGFEGTPMNFLVAIDRKGNFLDVELLHQHEPVFLGGLGEAPLKEFISQYAGHNLRQQFLIAQNAARNRSGPGSQQGPQTQLDGVSKATASVRIVNQTILSAALEVARARLGFASAPRSQAPAAQARPDVADPVAFDTLLKEGMVGHLRLSNREVEQLYAGSEGAGVDADALAHPDDTYVELYIGYLNAPSIGRSILGPRQYAEAMARNFDNRHLWWIASRGRWSLVDEDFVPGAQSPRLRMEQDGLILELRDQGFEPTSPSAPADLNAARLFGVHAAAGLDPGRPLALTLTLTRARGMILPTLTHREATLHYQPPARLFSYPPAPPPEWLQAWQARQSELLILGSALILLSAVLARPRWLSISARRLALFRWGFLGFTLVYLGWYAQGQLSIVQLTGALKALKAGQGLGSFLYDPVSLLLIGFTLASLLVWGRGTFCGWLCPFGALQELVGKLGASPLARRLGWPRLRLKPATTARLAWGGPLILTLLLLAALVAPGLGERLNEAEPFKTAITVGFDREWPYVAYALGLLLLGASHYKFFCRFLCPLGAALSLGGRLRRWNWLPRRTECGPACQRCAKTCAYDAIAPSGEIRYQACFQCLDCVGIYHDPQRCAPVVLYGRKGKRLAVQAQPGASAQLDNAAVTERRPQNKYVDSIKRLNDNDY